MAAKKTTEAVKEEVVKAEAVAAEVKEDAVKETEVEANVPYIGYIPLELRNKLETVAGKMLDQLIGFNGEFNASQLNSINTAMEIYRTIRY